MSGKRVNKRVWLLTLTVSVLALVTPACGETVSPTPAATPRPSGEVDTGMGGDLSIQGVVRDTSGNVAPDVYVNMTVFEEGVYWDRTDSGSRQLGEWSLYTDETGSYAFNNLKKVTGGHYQVWFNSGPEYGNVYESSGYYITEKISGDAYVLDVTAHPITDSALSAVIRYEDADGATKNYFASPLGPDRRIELNRGTGHDGHEYTIGANFESDGSKGYLSGLAGGTYYLIFQYVRSDGAAVECTSPFIEVPAGETTQFDYTIPLDSCNTVQ